MPIDRTSLLRSAGAASSLLLLVSAVALPAAAAEKASMRDREQITETATIKSIDKATRHIVLTNAQGENFSMKVPPEVRNFDTLIVGDKIHAKYTRDTEYVLSAPNAALPADAEKQVSTLAAKGQLPSGAVANHIVVTGAIVGIDMAKHSMKIVSPQGGEVFTINVATAEGQKNLAKAKVGDRITAYVTESLLMAATPG